MAAVAQAQQAQSNYEREMALAAAQAAAKRGGGRSSAPKQTITREQMEAQKRKSDEVRALVQSMSGSSYKKPEKIGYIPIKNATK